MKTVILNSIEKLNWLSIEIPWNRELDWIPQVYLRLRKERGEDIPGLRLHQSENNLYCKALLNQNDWIFRLNDCDRIFLDRETSHGIVSDSMGIWSYHESPLKLYNIPIDSTSRKGKKEIHWNCDANYVSDLKIFTKNKKWFCDISINPEKLTNGKSIFIVDFFYGKRKKKLKFHLTTVQKSINAWIEREIFIYNFSKNAFELNMKFFGNGKATVTLYKSFERTVQQFGFIFSTLDGEVEKCLSVSLSLYEVSNIIEIHEYIMILVSSRGQELYWKVPISLNQE